mmetsp:Transcript_58978/g.104808  ORF Transcript_58978/g.104808 Transcript_58978/m.104808 type:complete len:454 (-) Transcript_58978:252-1613(-)
MLMQGIVSSRVEWVVDHGTPRNLDGDAEVLFTQNEEDDNESVEIIEDKDTIESVADKLRSFFVKPRKSRNVKLAGMRKIKVTVVAPGAGLGANAKVYMSLKQDQSLRLRVAGRSGMPYDRYPPAWPQGAPAPNLESFAQDIMSEGNVKGADCLIFGSRGGQVILPTLWNTMGEKVPPAIVVNGGCAMNLPIPCNWPRKAITFLILGGQDYFKKPHHSAEQYMADCQNHVPKSNSTTAILYVHEMRHMPDQALLTAIVRQAIAGMVSWKATGCVPLAVFERMARSVQSIGVSSKFMYTCSPGVWQQVEALDGLSPLVTPLAATAHLQEQSSPIIDGPVGMPPKHGLLHMSPHRQPVGAAGPTELLNQAMVAQLPARPMQTCSAVAEHSHGYCHVPNVITQARQLPQKHFLQNRPRVDCTPRPLVARRNLAVKVSPSRPVTAVMLPNTALLNVRH